MPERANPYDKLEAISALAQQYGYVDVRIFGSWSHGTAKPTSDVDILVKAQPGTPGSNRFELSDELEALLGYKVDLHTEEELSPYIKEQILSEKPPENRDLLPLYQIRDAIYQILSYMPADRSEFLSSRLLQDAVVWNIQVMGEAVKRLSSELTSNYPHIPWSEMARMRDRVVHKYDDIDYRKVWDIAHQELPSQLEPLETLIQESQNQK